MSALPTPVPPLTLPALATDTHVHIFDPEAVPYDPQRRYTPAAAPVPALQVHLQRLGLGRVVLVQPSVYGADNRALLRAIQALGPERARGVVVLDLAGGAPTAQALGTMGSQGVRGLRLNFEVAHQREPARVLAALDQARQALQGSGWHLQVHGAASLLPLLAQAQPTLGLPLVLDHLGGLLRQPGAAHSPDWAGQWEALRRLLDSGAVWVKLSAFYRCADGGPGHPALAPWVQALLAGWPERLVWGSDWPHTSGGAQRDARDPLAIEPFQTPDLAATLATLQAWCPPGAWQRLMVDNPAQLYRF
ncbi:amidohydrolase family protein [Ideonella livida]|uniref:Amidohydrolase family protein n=1 Tax=Ideonella livida TaxID=2707176 RepID=A0A7C9TL77_9BURK|nr:amidohydrolase family protein [Ideonella livida]NDY93201.1 amidohydrolase family protein [Ideonella livida]